MPTYEYRCEKCGETFEVFQSITAPSLRYCPKDKCRREPWGRGKVKREIGGGAGLLFKGSGFYITDYRSEGYRQAAKKESGAPAAPASAKSENSGATTGSSGAAATAKKPSSGGAA